MPQDTTPDRYHAPPAEAFHGKPAPLADDFAIVSTVPPADPDFEDKPRRHKANVVQFKLEREERAVLQDTPLRGDVVGGLQG